MPTFDYHCPANGRTLEVMHPLDKAPGNWGDLRRMAGIEDDPHLDEKSVERLYSFGAVVSRLGEVAPEGCGRPECGRGYCAGL